ncbi:MAG: VanW family protein, partial [Actinomycetota bacterium]|nr:VanW family protein [Actinomycetota bacterium]
RGLLVVGALVALLVLAYVGDLLFSTGSVPRGVVVAGQQIGGLSRAAAIEKLQGAIEPRSSQLIQVTAGEVRSEVDPKVAGLAVDYEGTLDQAGAQPLNPITRITSFFGSREVPVVNKSDERSVRTAMEQLAPVVDRDPKDGNVRFEGLNPLPVAPEPGQRLDVEAAVDTLEQQWAGGTPVALPLITEQPSTTPEDVQKAIDEVARPAVSGPLAVTGEGANGTVRPEDIAQALTFEADPDGPEKLVPQINVESLTDVVKPQLASTEKPAVDASLDLATTPARVVPSVDGRGIDYKATFANLVPVLTGTGPRTVAAVYAPKPAEVTTQAIQSLGAATEISTFTTGGFAADSGVNIRRAAEAIDGKIVAPGETFSLNGATAPRNASTGYIPAGIIEDGHPAKGVGGGVSQLATTLYNASYFAGMTDIEHKEHSYYISRYPVAREATVFEGLIDVKFRNDGPTPVLIRTAWTPRNVTVRFLGQKQWDVTSDTGPRSNPTPPQLVTLPPGQPCSPSKGSPGFTATDTRTMRNVQTGEATSKTRTVRYNPQPIVRCG